MPEERRHDGPYVHSCPIKKGCICDRIGFQQSSSEERRRLRQYNKIKWILSRLWRKLADQAWCICLADRDDRLRESAEQFHLSGLCLLVRYYRCVKPTDEECEEKNIQSRGRYGCWDSHHSVAMFGVLDPRTKRMLVFEDDLQFHLDVLSPKTLQTLIHDVKHHLPDDWDVYKLGQLTLWSYPVMTKCRHGKRKNRRRPRASSSASSSSSPSWPRIWRSNSGCTHAMLWNRTGFGKMAMTSFEDHKSVSNEETDVDLWMCGRFNMYACFPQLVRQSESPTSNIGNFGKGPLSERFDRFYRQTFIPSVLNHQGKHHRAYDIGIFLFMPIISLVLIFIFMAAVTRLSKWSLNTIAERWLHSRETERSQKGLHDRPILKDNYNPFESIAKTN